MAFAETARLWRAAPCTRDHIPSFGQRLSRYSGHRVAVDDDSRRRQAPEINHSVRRRRKGYARHTHACKMAGAAIGNGPGKIRGQWEIRWVRHRCYRLNLFPGLTVKAVPFGSGVFNAGVMSLQFQLDAPLWEPPRQGSAVSSAERTHSPRHVRMRGEHRSGRPGLRDFLAQRSSEQQSALLRFPRSRQLRDQ